MLDKIEVIEELCEDIHFDFISKDIKNLFSDMNEGLGRITDIVQNLRDFSRVDQAGDFVEYDFNKGIKSTLMVANNEIKYNAKIKTDFGKIPLIQLKN